MTTNDTALAFLAAAAFVKGAGERPALEQGDHGDVDLQVAGRVGGQAVYLHVTADSVKVGAPSEATATCSVSMYGVLARALRLAGCTRDSVARLVTEATAAELRGEEDPEAAAVKATVEQLRAAFAVALPRVPRVGALTIKGARVTDATDATDAGAEVAAK